MNLRRCLYMAPAGGGREAFQKIARWTRVFPASWEIVFAEARPAVMDGRDVDSPILFNVAADANRALERLTSCVGFLLKHPQLDEVEGLARYLEGMLQHMSDLVIANAPAPLLYACVEDSDSHDAFAPVPAVSAERLARLASSWERLERAIAHGNFDAVEELLGFTAVDLQFADWKAWAGVFGLALFQHKYFHDAFRQPFPTEFVDYDYDDLGSENALGGDLYRFKSGAKWGVKHLRGDEEGIVLEPRWDRVLRTSPRDHELLWVRRGGHYGLVAIDGPSSHLLLEPVLDEVGEFKNGLAIARSGSKMGVLASDGRWHVQPVWDEVSAFLNGYAIVKLGRKFGFIDSEGSVSVAPQFDEVDDFNETGTARVRIADFCGLIRNGGDIALPLDCSRLEWSDEFTGWVAVREGATTLLDARGAPWIEADWDAIEVGPSRTIRVRRGNRVGLLDWTGMKQVVPCEFSAIESLEPHVAGGCAVHVSDLMRVTLVPGETAPRRGVWSTTRQRLVVPCIYDFVWLTLLGDADAYGFIVANRNAKRGESSKGKYRVGLLHADGRTLIEQAYAWIGEPTALNKADARDEIRDTIHFSWSRGEPVAAALTENGGRVWLSPPTSPHENPSAQARGARR